MCVCWPGLVNQLGAREALVKPALKIRVANGELGEVLGAFFATSLVTTPWGGTVVNKEMIYVMSWVSQLYLSRDSAVALGVIHTFYLQLGDVCQGVAWVLGYAEEQRDSGEQGEILVPPCEKISYVNDDYLGPRTMDCGCPVRKLPPGLPKRLPLEPAPENRERIQEWIKQRYAALRFNVCGRQQLPLIEGIPPLDIHIDPEVRPVAVAKAFTVLVHWVEKVKADLERDLALGVI